MMSKVQPVNLFDCQMLQLGYLCNPFNRLFPFPDPSLRQVPLSSGLCFVLFPSGQPREVF